MDYFKILKFRKLLKIKSIAVCFFLLFGCGPQRSPSDPSSSLSHKDFLKANGSNPEAIEGESIDSGQPLYPVRTFLKDSSDSSSSSKKNLLEYVRFTQPIIKIDQVNKKFHFFVTIETQSEKLRLHLNGQIGSNGRVNLEESTERNNEIRLRAIGQCLDRTCGNAFVDIYYRENGIHKKKQFLSFQDEENHPEVIDKPNTNTQNQKQNQSSDKQSDVSNNQEKEEKKKSECDEFSGCAGEYVGYPVESSFYDQIKDWRQSISGSSSPDPNHSRSYAPEAKTGQVVTPPQPQPNITGNVQIVPTSKSQALNDQSGLPGVGVISPTVPSTLPSEGTTKILNEEEENSDVSQESTAKGPYLKLAENSFLNEDDLKKGAKSAGLPFSVCIGKCDKKENSGRFKHGYLIESSTGPNFFPLSKGDGYEKMSPERQQHYGSGLLIKLIEKTAAFFKNQFKPTDPIIVNAISRKGGGPLGRHLSHQNGLDADIVYVGENKWGSVLDGRGQLKRSFDMEGNYQYFKLLVETGFVNRIFVDKKVKEGMCQWAKAQNKMDEAKKVLTHLRIQRGHHDHFHLRALCSPYYHLCRNQIPPEGAGC